MCATAETLELARDPRCRRGGRAEQSGQRFDTQNACDRIVDARLRNRSGAHLRKRVLIERLPTIGSHQHVDAREYRGRTAIFGAAGDLFVRIPIANDESVEAESVL